MARWAVVSVLAALCLAGCDARPPVSNPAEDGTAGTKSRGFLSAMLRAPGGASEKKAARATDAATAPPLAKKSMAGGSVVVAGPEGYCIDPETAEGGRSRGFAVIASCRILTDGKRGHEVAPVIVTVTVGPRGLEKDLPSAKALAQATGAALLDGQETDGLVLAHLAAGGDRALEGGDARHWRGAFVLNGRMVGLALYAPKDAPMADSGGAVMLDSVRARIVSLSPQQ